MTWEEFLNGCVVHFNKWYEGSSWRFEVRLGKVCMFYGTYIDSAIEQFQMNKVLRECFEDQEQAPLWMVSRLPREYMVAAKVLLGGD